MKEYTLIFPDITKREIAAVVQILSDKKLLPDVAYRAKEGGVIHRLAQGFAEFLSEPEGNSSVAPVHTVCLASATGALYALLRAAKVEGGEVITTSLNFTGVLNAIVMAGAFPRFVDVDPKSFCMDVRELKKAVTEKTRAIVVVHLNGFADLDALTFFVEKRGLQIPVIQDISLAVASTHGGKRPGLLNIGERGSLVASLATSKIITGLGGAVVVSNERRLVEEVLSIAYQGASLTDLETLSTFGANLKMNDLNAAIALEVLKRRNKIFEKRKKLKSIYDEELKKLVKTGKVRLQDRDLETIVTHYAVLLPDWKTIAKAMYRRHGVYLGMWHTHHMQKIYRGLAQRNAPKLKITESIAPRFAFLPFHTRLTEKDVQFICHALAEEITKK